MTCILIIGCSNFIRLHSIELNLYIYPCSQWLFSIYLLVKKSFQCSIAFFSTFILKINEHQQAAQNDYTILTYHTKEVVPNVGKFPML